jgi:small subunit ribosomal protein S18e
MATFVLENPDDFKHILRILNTNIDGKKPAAFAIRAIKGCGRRFAFLICKILKINPGIRAGEMTEGQCNQVAEIIANPEKFNVPRWFLNRQRDYKEGKNMQVASNVLETKLREDIERYKKIKSNKGIRHHWGLRVRGQHTKSTGRRGVTIGVERKKK